MKKFEYKGTLEISYKGHTLSVDARVYYDPGNTYGDPYYCYPPESEVEIYHVVEKCHGRERTLSVESMDRLADEEDFVAALFKAAIEHDQYLSEEHAEHLADEKRDRRNWG